MYKKIIKNDLFNISQRIKSIDKGYYIVFNIKTNKYEVHNQNQKMGSYCLTSPYPKLDCRLLDYVVRTSLRHNKDLLQEIELNNFKLQKSSEDEQKEYSKTRLKEIYEVIDNGSKEYDLSSSYRTKWI